MDSYEGYVGRIIGHLGGIAPTSFPRLAHSHKNRSSPANPAAATGYLLCVDFVGRVYETQPGSTRYDLCGQGIVVAEDSDHGTRLAGSKARHGLRDYTTGLREWRRGYRGQLLAGIGDGIGCGIGGGFPLEPACKP